jgi:hypothetical protein
LLVVDRSFHIRTYQDLAPGPVKPVFKSRQ